MEVNIPMETPEALEEEFEKAFEKAFARCRGCNHVKWIHIKKGKPCGGLSLGPSGETIECTCLKYIPKDNLEYLEWLNEGKNNV